MRARLRHFLARVNAARQRQRLDQEFAHEIDAHLSMLVDDNISRGMTRDEAERAARIRFGGPESLKARHRDARGLPALDDLWQDVRFALRLTLKERWFSAAAVAALAIGIGANATGFSIINAAFVRGLPFENASRICEVSWRTSGGQSSVTYEDLAGWRTAARTVDLAAFNEAGMNVSDEAAMPEQVSGAWVTANLFGVLRQKVLLGRDFVSGEDAPNAAPVVIIGHRLWTTRYRSDPGVLGKVLRLNGRHTTIVGVMTEGMKFPETADIWAPLVATASELETGITALARIHDDVDRAEAETELSTIALRLAAGSERTRAFRGLRMETYGIGGYAKTMFPTVMAAVGLVLLIACANVANLLLSRSAFRAREMALRIAVGATRGRVIRQLLIESLVLSALGGIAGLWLAMAGVAAFEQAMSVSEKPYWLVFTVDGYVLAYVAVICVATSVLFGLAPALHVSKANSHELLKDGGRSATISPRFSGFSSAMIVLELALTFVLLAGAGLLARSFATLYTIDLGIDTARLITMRVDLPEDRYTGADARWRFLERVQSRVASLPGIDGATLTTGVPGRDGGERLMEVDGRQGTTPPRFVSTVAITPEFFTVVNRDLRRGREFTTSDGATGAEAVIVNEELASQFFPGDDAVGQRLRFTRRNAPPGQPVDQWRTIVGVSPSIRHGSPVDAYSNATVYVPYRQDAPAAAWLLIRTAVPPESVMEVVRGEVRAEDDDQPVYGLQSVDQLLEQDRWPYRVFGGLFAILAIASLVLAAVGLYAVMAYAVSCRTHEIGVRMAVGASRRTVSWLILKRGLVQLAIGLPIGMTGALALGAVLQQMLVDMSPADPVTLLGDVALLTGVTVGACLVPTFRALRVDPLTALRTD
jgi:predicted permease